MNFSVIEWSQRDEAGVQRESKLLSRRQPKDQQDFQVLILLGNKWMRKVRPSWEGTRGNLDLPTRWLVEAKMGHWAPRTNKAEDRLWGRRGERQRRQGQRIPIYIKPIPCLKPDVLQAWPHILLAQGCRARAHLCGWLNSHPWYQLIRRRRPSGALRTLRSNIGRGCRGLCLWTQGSTARWEKGKNGRRRQGEVS